jgi:DNA sulfur modification protein DndD
MLLEKLVLCDVGTFRGEQTLELRPATRSGKNRPVVLFGGLNGAGKTTLLNSIRHVLYGRQALDGTTTQRAYDDFLRGLIHNPVAQLVRPDRARIELQFTYARLGTTMRYRVCRSWIDRGSFVEETLQVAQNDDPKPLLEGDGAQAFLSQLIPAGVSQFFFFDGEKIGALAKDDTDDVLADAIRRLLGLDMADRLRSDLAVFLRASRTNRSSSEARRELLNAYAEIETAKSAIQKDEADLQDVLVPSLTLARQEVERRRAVLTDQGGAWAVNRKGLEQSLHDISEQKAELEDQLREELSGLSVFALAPGLCSALIGQAQAERTHGEKKLALEALMRESKQLKSLLAKSLSGKELGAVAAACVDEWLRSVDQKVDKDINLLHGFASSDVDRLDAALRGHLPTALGTVKAYAGKLSSATAEATKIHDLLAHAPSDESIEEAFTAYQNATKRATEVEMENRLHVENIRIRVLTLLSLIRKVKKLEEAAQKGGISTRAEELAGRIQEMIGDFKTEAAQEKCKTLERHFAVAFRRLARKEDIVDHAVIDPSTFTVTLVDRHGRTTPKKRLSAGEKQIFAIAMLEALAKTSGRNLPIIIDTPLGRLDSRHRANLVRSYFPLASHQVIVLSTDTEVDQAFYEGLSPSISHSFHLSFDEDEGYTTVSKGYFWKQMEPAHAA